jgi:phage terminase small subunit
VKLTLKQKAFADYFIKLGNATEAARKAGYKGKNLNRVASENLSKLDIKNYIDERLKQIEGERIADAAEVLKYLTTVMRGESQAEIVVVEGDGDGMSSARRIEKAPDEKEKLKAAELLGKRYSLFTDNTNVNASVGVTIIDDLGDDNG